MLLRNLIDDLSHMAQQNASYLGADEATGSSSDIADESAEPYASILMAQGLQITAHFVERDFSIFHAARLLDVHAAARCACTSQIQVRTISGDLPNFAATKATISSNEGR